MDTSRRTFFRKAAAKAGEHVVDKAAAKLEARAAQWVRPPWARAELEFVLACTRCNGCIDACPQALIFALPASFGMDVAGTPALDLQHNSCLLCQDWPCLIACEPEALKAPEKVEAGFEAIPRLAKTQLRTDYCLPYQGPECGACEGICPIPDTLVFDGVRPRINSKNCVGCGQCRQACIAQPNAIQHQSLYYIKAQS